jgi:radical SAM protein with 4Fe4S-binding SPASM domain
VHELSEIASFCRHRTKDYFRFDPFLHLRFDADHKKNADIKSERLSPEEIVAIEQADSERFGALEKNCDKLICPQLAGASCDHLFHCGTGSGSFTVSYDGFFRLCSSLWHPDCICDLKKITLKEAWQDFVPRVRGMRSASKEFKEKCRVCPIINLCLWCPAHAYLETGRLDEPVDYFCQVAHARQEALENAQETIND